MCYTLEQYAVDPRCGLHTVCPELNVIDTEACMCRECPNITMCVHMSIGSRNRTIHNALHISLHVSSGTEPTHQSRHTLIAARIHSRTHIMSTCRWHKLILLRLFTVEHINKCTSCSAEHANTCINPGHVVNPGESYKHRCGYACSLHPQYQVHFTARSDVLLHFRGIKLCTNDPSAGSPTETLLRLLLPLSDKVYTTCYCNFREPIIATVWIIHRITRSVGATGGVYKGQGRNQHELMTHTY